MDCKNFGEIWIVRCSSLVSWKMSNGRLFTLSNIGVGNVFKTTTTTRCAMCWASIVHFGHICTCPVSSVLCTLQTLSYIASNVLHCKLCPTLQTLSYIEVSVSWKTVQLLVIRFSTSSQYQLKGGLIHFLQSRFRIFLKLSGFLPPLNMCEKCSKFHKNALQGLFNT